MTIKKNLASLAKGKTKTKTATTKSKQLTVTSDVNDRDLKVKLKVEELLQDIKLTKSDDVQTIPERNEDSGSVEWLEEQLQVLIERNEQLQIEIKQLKENSNPNSSSDSLLYEKVIELFGELQNGYVEAGFNQYNQPNFFVRFPAFLNRMILFFPFLEKYKTFK